MPRPLRSSPRAFVLLGLGVVLFAMGAKLAVVHHYGTDQPYADQWAGEGLYLVHEPLNYPLTLGMMTAPHGEHRPALMRYWVRGLIVANRGQWDCFVELVANLLIFGAFLAITWRSLARLTSGLGLGVAAVLMAALFAEPYAYENYLWGFQSQFLFLFLCGMLHLQGTLGAMRLGPRWWLAQLAGFLGLFSIAAGSMSAAALIFMAGVGLWRGRRDAWVWGTLAANVLLLGLGLWMLPAGAAAPGHHFAQLGAVAGRMGCLLSWPFAGTWWSLLVQAPGVVLLVSWWRNRDPQQADGDGRLVAVGVWVVCIVFAVAYGREITPQTIGVRYFDVMILGLFINGLALVRLIPRWRGWRHWAGITAAVAWLLWLGIQLWACNYPTNLGVLFKNQHDLAMEQERVIRDFLVSGDLAPLEEFANFSHRFPNFDITLDLLSDPKVRPYLPPSLVSDGHRGPLSRWARAIAARWPVLVGLGAAGLVAGLTQLRRGRVKERPA